MSVRLRVGVLTPETIVEAGVRAILGRHPEKFEVLDGLDLVESRSGGVLLYDALFMLRGEAHFGRLVDQSTARILVMDRELRPGLGAQALRLGAHGWFSSDVDEQALIAAVSSAGTGWRHGHPGVDPTVGSGESTLLARRVGSGVGLIERELEILTLVVQGYSNPEIGNLLFLSVNSIKTYIRTGYRRIGVHSRAGAMRWGIEARTERMSLRIFRIWSDWGPRNKH